MWLIFIIFLVCSLLTLIPYEKYQKKYMDFVHDFNNVPQKHYDKQIEMANMHFEKDKKEVKEEEPHKEDYKYPYYIRDRKNRHILHKYKKN